jgi:hypothetical protein
VPPVGLPFLPVLLGIELAGCSGSNGMMPTPTPTTIPFFSGLYEIDANSATSSAVTAGLTECVSW